MKELNRRVSQVWKFLTKPLQFLNPGKWVWAILLLVLTTLLGVIYWIWARGWCSLKDKDGDNGIF